MKGIKFYIVDVFTNTKYGGNQLGVFIDFEDTLSDAEMLAIARELNFSEVAFIKKQFSNSEFGVRIFTPEYEVPFAGHPSLGTAYVISNCLLSSSEEKLVLKLKHGDINILLASPSAPDKSVYTMLQSQPEFGLDFTSQAIAEGLGIDINIIDPLPILQISTGLPYIIIPIKNLESINSLVLQEDKLHEFLMSNGLFKTNNVSGLTTSLLFVTHETHNPNNDYNVRMFCLENGKIVEDPATGSANGCLLAYLLKTQKNATNLTVEQGYQINRNSTLYLNGTLKEGIYQLEVGGQVVPVSEGIWSV